MRDVTAGHTSHVFVFGMPWVGDRQLWATNELTVSAPGAARAATAEAAVESAPRVDGLGGPDPETRCDANNQTHDIFEQK